MLHVCSLIEKEKSYKLKKLNSALKVSRKRAARRERVKLLLRDFRSRQANEIELLESGGSLDKEKQTPGALVPKVPNMAHDEFVSDKELGAELEIYGQTKDPVVPSDKSDVPISGFDVETESHDGPIKTPKLPPEGQDIPTNGYQAQSEDPDISAISQEASAEIPEDQTTHLDVSSTGIDLSARCAQDSTKVPEDLARDKSHTEQVCVLRSHSS